MSRPLLKVILIGDSGVGKTALYFRYTKNKFSEKYQSTLGADFTSKEEEVDGCKVLLQIWDTAGQERFQGLGPIFFRGADCVIFVYDVTDRQSFEHLQNWKDSFLELAQIPNTKGFPVVCIGNKLDLDDRKILSNEVLETPWCQNFLKFYHFECSAKDGTNVTDAFKQCARAAREFHLNSTEGPVLIPETIIETIKIDERTNGPGTDGQSDPSSGEQGGCSC